MKTIVVIAVSIMLMVSGCQTANPLYKPAKGISESVLPEYEKYVENDKSLDPFKKKIRIMNSRAFKKLIEEYEKK